MLRKIAIAGALASLIAAPSEALAWGGGHWGGGFGGGHWGGGFGGGHWGGGHWGGGFGGGHWGGGPRWGYGRVGWGNPLYGWGYPYYRRVGYWGYGGCYRPRTVWTGWGWTRTWVNVCAYPGWGYGGWSW